MGAAILPRVLSQLHGCTNPKPNQWQACCPVHKGGSETNPSFGVRLQPDGTVDCNCFTGCPKPLILSTLGITDRDLLPDSDTGAAPAKPQLRVHQPAPAASAAKWEETNAKAVARFQKSDNAQRMLAELLGVPLGSWAPLTGIGCRTATDFNDCCWTFPERNAQGQIIGIMRRFEPKPRERKSKHKKAVMKDSERGLYIPDNWQAGSGPLVLPEGESCTITAIVAGFSTVGRPNNILGVPILAELLAKERREIIWLGENDDGAGRERSREAAESLATLLKRSVTFAMPPDDVKDLRDWLTARVAAGASWVDAGAAFLAGIQRQTVMPASIIRTPIQLVTTNELEINDKVIDAISDDPTLFVRADAIVNISCIGAHKQRGCHFPPSPQIAFVSTPTLRERISDRVKFFIEKDGKEIDVHPPEWCVSAVRDRKSWPSMRYLEAIVEYPVLRPDGSLVSEPGYDESTGVFYNPSGDAPVIPAVLDRAAAVAAWNELHEMISEFPFKEKMHEAAWLAALLTPLARFAFRGAAPIFLVDGNVPGAGKGLLCDTISIPLTGQEFATTAYSQEDEEMRKKVTTIAVRGSRLVLLDNIAGSFGGSAMDQVLTSIIWEDRLLGGNTSVCVPLRATWFGTGNNIQIAGDMLRRVCHIRLETEMEKPEERTGFRRPKLRKWMKAERSKLLGAALTILLAYFREGKPPQKMSEWGGYEEWSEVVRAAVVWLGLPDPAATKKEMRASGDAVIAAMQFLLENWGLLDKDHRGITANQIIALTFPKDKNDIKPALDEIAEAITMMVSRPTGQQLSTRFRQFRGRTLGNYCLNSYSKSGNVIRWSVYKAGTEDKVFPVSATVKKGEDGEDEGDKFPGAAKPGNLNVHFPDGVREHPHYPHHPHHDSEGKTSLSEFDD